MLKMFTNFQKNKDRKIAVLTLFLDSA